MEASTTAGCLLHDTHNTSYHGQGFNGKARSREDTIFERRVKEEKE
jgi:hypothetical protein